MFSTSATADTAQHLIMQDTSLWRYMLQYRYTKGCSISLSGPAGGKPAGLASLYPPQEPLSVGSIGLGALAHTPSMEYLPEFDFISIYHSYVETSLDASTT